MIIGQWKSEQTNYTISDSEEEWKMSEAGNEQRKITVCGPK